MPSKARPAHRRMPLAKAAAVRHLALPPDEHEPLCEDPHARIIGVTREGTTCEHCISVYDKMQADLAQFGMEFDQAHDAGDEDAPMRTGGEAVAQEIDDVLCAHIWDLVTRDEIEDLCHLMVALGVRIGAMPEGDARQKAHEAIARAVRDGCGEI